eukprot:11154967-Lingulodinium_polyedra.AAC.1
MVASDCRGGRIGVQRRGAGKMDPWGRGQRAGGQPGGPSVRHFLEEHAHQVNGSDRKGGENRRPGPG